MPSVCAIVRSTGPNDGTERLTRELAPAFGDNVYLIIDRYEDVDAPELLVDGRQILVGRKFLSERGLPWFPGVGWQCGDFVYYAAAEALPMFDYYFVMEDDVSFMYKDNSFFQQLLQLDFDIALYGMCPAPDEWVWTETMSKFSDARIHHAFFPISCVSKRVIKYFLVERIKYSARFVELRASYANYSYANDEVFVATMAVNGGFVCGKFEQMFPVEAWSNFSLFWPIHPDELKFLSDCILHPVYSGERARRRFYQAMYLFPENKTQLLQRLEEYSSRLGQDTWEDFSGIHPSTLLYDDHVSRLFKLQVPTKRLLEQKFNLTCGAWIFQYKVLVFEFATNCGKIVFDVSYSRERQQLIIEMFARQPAGTLLLAKLNRDETSSSRVEVGAFSEGLTQSTMVDEVSNIIAESLLTVLDSPSNASAEPNSTLAAPQGLSDNEARGLRGWRRAARYGLEWPPVCRSIASKIWRTIRP